MTSIIKGCLLQVLEECNNILKYSCQKFEPEFDRSWAWGLGTFQIGKNVGFPPSPLPSRQPWKAFSEDKIALLVLKTVVERVPEVPACPAEWRGKLGGTECWSGWAGEEPLLSLGGFSVISRPLTDFEITASSYFILPIIDWEALSNRLGGALEVLSSFR